MARWHTRHIERVLQSDDRHDARNRLQARFISGRTPR